MLFYYITDRKQFGDTETIRRTRLLGKISEAARNGVDFIQLREKDLSARDLESIARSAVDAVRRESRSGHTRLLINSRTDIAIACGADGVHLRSDDVPVATVRQVWERAEIARKPVIGVSCHTEADVKAAASDGADFVAFAPVFGKSEIGAPGVGLDSLRATIRIGNPVFALGGVTLENARACIEAGAAGIAGISLFQNNDIADLLRKLRS